MQHYNFEYAAVPPTYGAYSHAVEAGDFVFVAGQLARDADTGELVAGDIGEQTICALKIVGTILSELGLAYRHIVRATVYLADISDFEAMNAAYRSLMPEPFPARSTPQVKLPLGARVGIEVTAFRPRPSGATS